MQPSDFLLIRRVTRINAANRLFIYQVFSGCRFKSARPNPFILIRHGAFLLRHHSPMFKLILTECRGNPPDWEWCVCDISDRPLKVGWKRTREEARHEAESALSNLLASGGNIPRKNIPPRGH